MSTDINLDDYTTRRKYDGCHPVIAKGLQQENPIFLLCRIWDDDHSSIGGIVTEYKKERYKYGVYYY